MKSPQKIPWKTPKNRGPRHVLNDAGHDVDGCTEEGHPHLLGFLGWMAIEQGPEIPGSWQVG